MLQGKVAVFLIFILGAILLIGAILNWKLLLDNNKVDFLNRKLGPMGGRIAIAVIGLLILLTAYYLHSTKKLEASAPDPSEVIFQF